MEADAALCDCRPASVRCAAAPTASVRSRADIDWDTLGFSLQHVGKTMYVAQWTPEQGWSSGSLQQYGPLQLMPSAQVFSYGQSIFEGMKAQRSAKGRVVLFRPDKNAERMRDGAARMLMPAVPKAQFVKACSEVVRENVDWVPPMGKGSFYLRPLLMGTGAVLGVAPSPTFTFTIFGAAVGAYFKVGQMTPIDLIVEQHFHRAAPGGTGGVKVAGNYSPVLLTQLEAKKAGYADVVYLDAKTDTYLEEVSSCNIFVVRDRTILTPPLQGTILPGVTRASVVELARLRGYSVMEEPVTVQEVMQADEVFTTGTAVVLSSVGSLTYKGHKRQFGTPGQPGPVALELYNALTQLQTEHAEDPLHWVHPVC